MKFTIRDILWLTAVTGLGLCWYHDRLIANRLNSEKEAAVRELNTNRVLNSVVLDLYRVQNYGRENGIYSAPPPPLVRRFDSYDVMKLMISKADCVILGEVEDEPEGFSLHEAASHVSGIFKVRILDVAKGKGLPVGNLASIHVDVMTGHPLLPKQGDKRVFFVQLDDLNKLDKLQTGDIRFCIEPAELFGELKRLADEMRRSNGGR